MLAVVGMGLWFVRNQRLRRNLRSADARLHARHGTGRGLCAVGSRRIHAVAPSRSSGAAETVTIRDVTLSDIERLGDAADTARCDVPDGRGRVPLVLRSDGTLGVGIHLADHGRQPARRRSDAGDVLSVSSRRRSLTTDEAHRRHYLFRIAVNLVHDHYRRPRLRPPAGARPSSITRSRNRANGPPIAPRSESTSPARWRG